MTGRLKLFLLFLSLVSTNWSKAGTSYYKLLENGDQLVMRVKYSNAEVLHLEYRFPDNLRGYFEPRIAIRNEEGHSLSLLKVERSEWVKDGWNYNLYFARKGPIYSVMNICFTDLDPDRVNEHSYSLSNKEHTFITSVNEPVFYIADLIEEPGMAWWYISMAIGMILGGWLTYRNLTM